MNAHSVLVIISLFLSSTPLARSKAVPSRNMINAAGNPFDVTYADDEKTVINAFDIDYNTTDFLSSKELMNQEDSPAIPNGEFFSFTQKNIDDAQQPLFYSVWSLEATKDPLYTEIGEWTFFVHQFMDDRNFMCSFDTQGCHNLPSLAEIKAKYPHRPTARLIFFTVQQFQIYHDTAVAVEVWLPLTSLGSFLDVQS